MEASEVFIGSSSLNPAFHEYLNITIMYIYHLYIFKDKKMQPLISLFFIFNATY